MVDKTVPAYTEPARREARFKAAQERIRKIVEAAPPLTDEQLADLSLLLTGGQQDGGQP